jgi:hypothetical protein
MSSSYPQVRQFETIAFEAAQQAGDEFGGIRRSNQVTAIST